MVTPVQPGFFARLRFRAQALFLHSKTVLVARIYAVGGLLVAAHDAIGTIIGSTDFTPLTTRVLDAVHIPPDLHPVVVSVGVSATGVAFEGLRRVTTKPLDQKADEALVALVAPSVPTPPPAGGG